MIFPGSDILSIGQFERADIERIFDLRRSGCRHKEIANHMNACRSYISQILSGQYWSHVETT